MWRYTQKGRCFVVPPYCPLVVLLSITLSLRPQFFSLPETPGSLTICQILQQPRDKAGKNGYGSEGIGANSQGDKVREGDARKGCDHPVSASSDRLYLRQV